MNEPYAGRFVLIRPLGEGGMGQVFLARDLDTGGECALKRLPRAAEARLADRLRAEFAALSRLRHPAVVDVRELGFSPDGQPFLVMEFVPGLSADRALAQGDWPALFGAMSRVAEGLEALHAAGVVHGDVKPQNIIVTPPADAADAALSTEVKLVDFGLSWIAGDAPRPAGGTLGYSAPEVGAGAPTAPSADLYSFGATLLALATHTAPTPVTPPSGSGRRAAGPPPLEELTRAGAPEGLVRLVMRLLAANPAERPASARDVRLELAALHPAARRPLAERLETDVFVGRPREEARIDAARRASFDRTRAILVEGPGGVGKSSLLARAAARANLADHTVVRVVRPLESDPGAAAGAVVRRIAAAAKLPAPGGTDVERLAETARAMAVLAAQGKPVVLVVDDADELDEQSFQMLASLLLHPQHPPVLWLWARRSGTGGVLDLAVDAGALERLPLEALDRDASERLVAARLGTTPPPGIGALLHERTQGHPGLLVASLRLAAQAGALQETEAGIVAHADAIAGLPLPENFEGALLARVGMLDARVRRVLLQLAACAGRATEADFAAMGSPLTPRIARALGEGRIASADAAGVWRLAPPALARAILAAAAPADRRGAMERALRRPALGPAERFHVLAELDRASEALSAAEQAYGAGPGESLAQRAAELATRHGAPGAALWWLRAAEFARRSGRYELAAERYASALSATPAPDATSATNERGRAWEGLTVALLRAGKLDELDPHFARALAEPLDPVSRANLLAGWSAAPTLTGDTAEAERRLNAVEEELRAVDDARALAICLFSRRWLALVRRQEAAAAELLREALREAVRAGDRILVLRARAQELGHDPTSDREGIRSLVAELRAEGHRYALHEALWILMMDLTSDGEWRAAVEVGEEVARNAIEDGRRADTATALVALATLDALMGHPSRALRRTRAARRTAGTGRHLNRIGRLRVGARAARTLGMLKRAERLARRVVREAQAATIPDELQWARVELTAVLATQERWNAAAKLAAESVPAGTVTSVADALLEACAGRGALRRGDRDEAETRLARIDAWRMERPRLYVAAHADVLRAELAVVDGDLDRAREAAARAVAGFEELPCPGDRGQALLELAELALERGDSRAAPAREWIARALEVFDRFQDDGRRVRALRAELRARADDSTAAAGGVTDRDLVQSFTGLLSSLAEPQQLARRALELAGRRFGAERGLLVMRESSTDALHTLAEYGSVDATARQHALGYSTRIVREVAHSGSSQVISDVHARGMSPSVSQLDLGLRSILCVPLLVHGVVSGVLYMDHSRRAEVFTDSDRDLLEAFARLIGLAIESSRGQFETEREFRRLISENRELSETLTERAQSDELIVGTHHKVRRLLGEIHRAARTPRSSVLITGETGTGKELVAVRIHGLSSRSKRTFLPVHCGAIPRDLIATRLFGHRRGAFTGALRDEPGVFERANGGTVFLDEIGEMPLEQQVALLRVLQSGEVQPLGASAPIQVNVRVIAATNQDLMRLVQEKRFREDLFFRLDVIHIHVPPLRERKSDIPALAQTFLEKFAREWGRAVPRLSREFLAAIMRSGWPGNVRELQHYVERVFANATGEVLYPDPLPNDLAGLADTPAAGEAGGLIATLAATELRLIQQALEEAEGNQSLAARILGIPEPNLRYRLKKYAARLAREKPRPRQKIRVETTH